MPLDYRWDGWLRAQGEAYARSGSRQRPSGRAVPGLGCCMRRFPRGTMAARGRGEQCAYFRFHLTRILSSAPLALSLASEALIFRSSSASFLRTPMPTLPAIFGS